jgi:enoyl-CoA hydratase/carnithine racemase
MPADETPAPCAARGVFRQQIRRASMTTIPAPSSDDVLKIEIDGNVAIVTINRPEMRNALDEAAVAKIDAFFSNVPPEVGAVVLQTEGPHFCAGLDLKEHHAKRRSPTEFMRVCQGWHRAFDKMQHGGIPIVAAMQGAVVGGGLELAAAAHVRVADRTAYFALPEGQRGIFTGGGATVRVARIITPGRMIELMLTGRVIDVEEGQRLGLAHYIADDARATALDLARKIAGNARLSNYAIVTAINKISDMSATDGLYTEGLIMCMVQTAIDDVQGRLGDFVGKRTEKVQL